jgi:hypothetical protein
MPVPRDHSERVLLGMLQQLSATPTRKGSAAFAVFETTMQLPMEIHFDNAGPEQDGGGMAGERKGHMLLARTLRSTLRVCCSRSYD